MAHRLRWIPSMPLSGLTGCKTLAAQQHEKNRIFSNPSEMRPDGREMPMPGNHSIHHGSQFSKKIRSKTIRQFPWQDAIAESGITRKEIHVKRTTRPTSDRTGTTTTNQFQIPLLSPDELQAAIDKHHLVKRNGFGDHIGGLSSGYGGRLSVEYASGETRWTARNHAIPIDITAVDSFYAYFENLPANVGRQLLDTIPSEGRLTYLSIERTAPGTQEFYPYDPIPEHKNGRIAILGVRRQTSDNALNGASSNCGMCLSTRDMDQLNALIDTLDLAEELAIAFIKGRTVQAGFTYKIHSQLADGTTLHADTIVKSSDAMHDSFA